MIGYYESEKTNAYHKVTFDTSSFKLSTLGMAYLHFQVSEWRDKFAIICKIFHLAVILCITNDQTACQKLLK